MADGDRPDSPDDVLIRIPKSIWTDIEAAAALVGVSPIELVQTALAAGVGLIAARAKAEIDKRRTEPVQ